MDAFFEIIMILKIMKFGRTNAKKPGINAKRVTKRDVSTVIKIKSYNLVF